MDEQVILPPPPNMGESEPAREAQAVAQPSGPTQPSETDTLQLSVLPKENPKASGTHGAYRHLQGDPDLKLRHRKAILKRSGGGESDLTKADLFERMERFNPNWMNKNATVVFPVIPRPKYQG